MFKVRAQNFLTFSDLEFDFTNRGLCLVQGENKDETLQKSNGAGKTNFVDALCWGLYGKSLKDETVDSVVNFKAKKNCFVEVTWGDYKVTRYRKHTQFKNDLQFFCGDKPLTGTTNKDTQERIDKVLGLNYKSFIKSVYFQQSTLNSFATATDAEQKEIIEDILSLNMITVAQDVAKDKAKELQKLVDEQDRKATLVNSRVADSRSRMNQLRLRSDQFEQQRKIDRTGIESQITLLESKRTAGDSAFDIAKARMLVSVAKPVAEHIPALEQEVKKLEQEYYGHLNGGRSADGNVAMVRMQIESLKQQRDAYLRELERKVCPTCKQELPQKPIDPRDWNGEIAALQPKLEAAQAEVNRINQAAGETKLAMDAKQKDIKSKRDLIQMANQMEQKIATEELRLKELQYLDERIAEQKNRLTEIDARLNPYTEQLGEEKVKVDSAESELAIINDEIFRIKARKMYYDYWVDGLGNSKLKSHIMESITPMLNERANYYSQFLTGGAFQIDISTQTVTAKGEIRDKFNVNVKHASGANYYSSSGGERKRIDICILLALQDLVASRASQPISLLVMDEVSENLDDIGVERMLELLHNITSSKGTCLYITHHEGMKPLFPNSITVTKQNGISKITC